MTLRFRANAENTVGYTMNYQWSIHKTGDTSFNIVNYNEEFEQTFTRAGEFKVNLVYTYTDSNGKQTSVETDSLRFTIKESKLEFPNAFSPNGDSWNNIYKAKVCQSIVEFRATIYNRWGQKLYSLDRPQWRMGRHIQRQAREAGSLFRQRGGQGSRWLRIPYSQGCQPATRLHRWIQLYQHTLKSIFRIYTSYAKRNRKDKRMGGSRP